MTRVTIYLICLGLCLLIAGRFLVFYGSGKPVSHNQQITLQTTLLTEPKTKGNFQSFTVLYDNRTRISVRISRFPLLHYGDSFSVNGVVKERVVKSNGIAKTVYSMDYPKIILFPESSNYLVGFASHIRRTVSATFHQYLLQPADSLLMGIVFGINEGLPESFQTALQAGGVLHVIAASGMNVTMVAGTLFFLLGRVMKRQHAVMISILGIMFYAVLSGLQPSILRASLMGILVFSATLLGRQNTALITLGSTGYLLLLWRPLLIEDVGFQLSFFSTLGILLIKPLFRALEERYTFLEDCTTTLSAQLATLPLMLMTFGQYGLLSVLVNALVLWTIPPLMILGSLAAITGFINHIFALPFLYLSLPFLWVFMFIVEQFGRYHGMLVTVPMFPLALTIGYYAVLAGGIRFIQLRFPRNPAQPKSTDKNDQGSHV